MDNVIVLIPIYRNYLEDLEEISLKINLKCLEGFTIKFISSRKLKNDVTFAKLTEKYKLDVVFFENKFFENIAGYNKLMLDLNFYNTFKNYKFMLICQLDALVLSKNLQFWIDENYDYVGAPWVVEDAESIYFDSMGNGGLSLRKIDKFIEVLKSSNFYFDDKKFFSMSVRVGLKNIFLLKIFNKLKNIGIKIIFLKFYLYFYSSNEDYFWAFIAQYFVEEFNLPSPDIALGFAFEASPKKCYEANKNQLPFGCHAWERYDKEFWLGIMKIEGVLHESITSKS